MKREVWAADGRVVRSRPPSASPSRGSGSRAKAAPWRLGAAQCESTRSQHISAKRVPGVTPPSRLGRRSSRPRTVRSEIYSGSNLNPTPRTVIR